MMDINADKYEEKYMAMSNPELGWRSRKTPPSRSLGTRPVRPGRSDNSNMARNQETMTKIECRHGNG